jgi:Ca-activated chloride channel homolog
MGILVHTDRRLPATALFFALLTFAAPAQQAPQEAGEESPYILKLSVNEVSLTYHVSDKRGKSINNLPLKDFGLLDNGKPQNKISSFRFYGSLPVRAGFLIDASGSMLKDLDRVQFIAELYAKQLLRKGADQAFVMGFGTGLKVTQEWTDNPDEIATGISSVPTQDYGTSGTAIFDSIYKVCRDRWPAENSAITGNFILLFTDGIDNWSHARIDDVINMCQRTRTAIYIFTNQWNLRGQAQGSKTLEERTSKSGGRLFLNVNREQIERDVATMDEDQRSQYRLDFSPSGLRRDGSFHHLSLRCHVPGAVVLARSGYYDVKQR